MDTDTAIRTQRGKNGILFGERMGVAPTEAELLEAFGYSTKTHGVVPGSAKAKQWPTTLKGKDGTPMQVMNYFLEIRVQPLFDSMLAQDDEFKAALLADIRREAFDLGIESPAPDTYGDPDAQPCMVELDVFDPHFQKLAWGQETGQNYDLDITARAYRGAAFDLIHEALRSGRRVARWLFVIGQDLFHTDNDRHETAAGTLQDVDSRTPKAARIVRKLITEIVLEMLKTAPVDVLNMPGNHAPDRDWFMGEIIDARFEGNPHVSVDNRPISRKYYRYGNTLLGFAHGKDEKPKDLRDFMSQEARKDWAETIFREWHLGHIHHETVKDERGVVVRYMPSIAGTDAWHYKAGWVQSQRGAKAYVWTPDRGLRLTLHHAIPLTAEEMSFTAPLLRGDR